MLEASTPTAAESNGQIIGPMIETTKTDRVMSNPTRPIRSCQIFPNIEGFFSGASLNSNSFALVVISPTPPGDRVVDIGDQLRN